MKSLPTLYSRTSDGRVQTWTMQIDGANYRTVTGYIDGARVESKWKAAKGKNPGKKNATTDAEQALSEAQSAWKKRTEKGYHEDIKNIDKATNGLDVMTAKDADAFIEKGKLNFKEGVMVQNKYNGVRCSAQLMNGRVVLMSRGFKEWTSVPHINKSLEGFFAKYPNAKLDGELYNYDLRQKLNELISIVRDMSLTEEELIESEQMVRYYIYDGFDFDERHGKDVAYDVRKQWIDENLPKFSKYYAKVRTWTVHSLPELNKLYEGFLADGEEGAMIRNPKGGYDIGRRSEDLLKYKPEDDAEGEILELIEGKGNWAGTAKTAKIRWNGKEFEATFKGSFALGVERLKNPEKWVGRTITFLYTGLTGKGVPNYARIDPDNCDKGDR
jgi:DNA ligase-1